MTTVCDNSIVRYGEYLGCQLFGGPHIPLFFRCQVWGVPGLPTCCWTSYSLIFEVPVLGSTWSANFSLDLIFPFFRCHVWGVPGLQTSCWTSYSLIFEVPGLGSTWSANFSLDLTFPYFWGARFREYLVFQFFVVPHFTLFWGARFGEHLVCQFFIGTHIPLFLMCHIQGFRYCFWDF